jgi:two-component system response regulator YesN
VFKIMIVDDEIIIRRGIITSIDWAKYDIEIVEEAKNGQDALDKLANNPVDVVLTDIRMPVMSGIELATRIKQHYPDIEIVVFSGYEDFQYAKQAMRIGVQHYLLKPVIAEELIAVFIQIRDKLNEAKFIRHNEFIKNKIFNENLPFTKSKIITSLLNKAMDPQEMMDKAKTLNINLSGPEYQVFLIDIDDFLLITEQLSQKDKEAYLFAVINIAEETLQFYLPGLVSYGEQEKIVGLVNIAHGYSIMDMCREIQSNIQKYLKLSTTIGIGRPSPDIMETRKSYSEALNSIQRKAFQGKGSIIAYVEGQHLAVLDDRQLIFFTDEEKRLIQNLKSSNAESVRQMITQYFHHFATANMSFKEVKGVCIRLVISLIQTLEEMGLQIEPIFGQLFIPHVEIEKFEVLQDLRHWFDRIIDEILRMTEQDKKRSFKKVVKDAVHYITQHYDQKISLTDVADHVYVTPAHLSKVFKEETGVTFVKWLNEFRVEEAQKLLKSTWLKTYEIAEKVGFQDYKYFSIIFKKYTGYSPRDYRNQ